MLLRPVQGGRNIYKVVEIQNTKTNTNTNRTANTYKNTYENTCIKVRSQKTFNKLKFLCKLLYYII